MTIFDEIGEIRIIKGKYENQVKKTLENKGYFLRFDEELENENVYHILVKSE